MPEFDRGETILLELRKPLSDEVYLCPVCARAHGMALGPDHPKVFGPCTKCGKTADCVHCAREDREVAS